MKRAFLAALMTLVGGFSAWALATGPVLPAGELQGDPSGKERGVDKTDRKVATFGGGCFWCVEAVFEELKGVDQVVSGYAGGRTANPTYDDVCSGLTGHAEVCQITYDPKVVSFPQLLEVFWKTHDPTTLNRQGNDVGTQYRSVVYYHDEEQKKLAEEYKVKLDAAGVFNRPIVTQIAPLDTFYPAEDYHQDYYRKNPQQGYCQFVIVPKLVKFRKVFQEQLKP